MSLKYLWIFYKVNDFNDFNDFNEHDCNLIKIFSSKEKAKEYIQIISFTQGLGNIKFRAISYKVYIWGEDSGELVEVDQDTMDTNEYSLEEKQI